MWGFFGGIDSKMSKVEEGSAALIRQQSKGGERWVQGERDGIRLGGSFSSLWRALLARARHLWEEEE